LLPAEFLSPTFTSSEYLSGRRKSPSLFLRFGQQVHPGGVNDEIEFSRETVSGRITVVVGSAFALDGGGSRRW
jgi:hypothetical protein